ncbi:MAG TPA: APH(3') family aminoglycoside O-phosphotransferase [Aggregatilineaceae bacterium]|jgi:aminoglycoside phosphotransferase|nr:APH(3') family aminoglycoside O-phosphotransferase [Aggregatilineaceae bacterium]
MSDPGLLRGQLPRDLKESIGDAPCEEVLTGWSGVRVYRIPGCGCLKVASDHLALRPERDRLTWLRRRLPVPELLYYTETGARQWMLVSEIVGLPSFHEALSGHVERVVTLLAEGLKTIHRLDITGCPFDQRLDSLLEAARHNMVQGRVDEDEFDPQRRGRPVEELYGELLAKRPTKETPIFTHGDYCLHNVLIDPKRLVITGFVDWGGAGLSDPYHDLALAARSITFDLGAQWVGPFFEAYGITEIDRAKVDYYQLVDEFF